MSSIEVIEVTGVNCPYREVPRMFIEAIIISHPQLSKPHAVSVR